ncbi:MAG: hypothetical protein PHX08_02220 [Lachnospiraceae bacterium]|nr:hypothetical protein [Lachnospiraceae bacterium]
MGNESIEEMGKKSKEQQKSQIIRYLAYVLETLLLSCILYGVLKTPQMQVRIVYALGQKTETVEYLLLDTSAGQEKVTSGISLQETASRRMFDTFFKITSTEQPAGITLQLQPRTADEDPRIQIRTMEIQNRNLTMYKYAPGEIQDLFDMTDVSESTIEDDRLCLTTKDNQYATLTAKDSFLEDYKDAMNTPSGLLPNLVVFWLLLAGLLILGDYLWNHKKSFERTDEIKNVNKKQAGLWQTLPQDRFQLCMCILMAAALVCVAIMALCSKFYAHPDEDVTRMAIDYYMTHWLPPSGHGKSLLGAYSNYGATRLMEHTLYYFVAGKLGWICLTIFHISKYYRVLNILLFAIMVGMLYKNRSNRLWMIIAIGITPQVWYLFSYATSDAWDFFWGYFIVYELLNQESMCNRFLRKDTWRTWAYTIKSVLVMAFAFSMLFRGKQNYYLILLFAFLVLVIRWWRQKEERGTLFVRYVVLAVCSLCLLIPRAAVENYVQNVYVQSEQVVAEKSGDNAATEKKEEDSAENAEIANDVDNISTTENKEDIEDTHLTDAKSSAETNTYTPTVTTVVTTRKSMGYSFVDVLIKDAQDIISNLTNSGVGSYGWLEYHNSFWYGFGVTGLYGIMGLLIVYHMIRRRRLAGFIDAVVLAGMAAAAYLMVVYTCWTSDFQAQGRYVLLITLVVGYYSVQDKEIEQDRKIQCLIVLFGILSMVSYVGKGMLNLL